MLAWFKLLGDSLFDGLYFFLLRRPRIVRLISGFARRWLPILRLGNMVLVTRADDTREVLERGDDFLLAPVNSRKILSGDFVISLDRGPRYDGEKALIREALPENRVDALERITDEACAGVLKEYGAPRSFNVVPFAERVTVRIIEEFWGLPLDGAHSEYVEVPDGEETMRLWMRKLAIVIGSREPAPFGMCEVGHACHEEFISYLQAACNRPSGMIAHILAHSDSNYEVALRNLAGLIVTGTTVVTKAFTHAFEQLLMEGEARDRAIAVAKGGRDSTWTEQQRVAMARLLIEALRFNPVFPMLARYAPRPATLARGTPREKEIPAGSNVVVIPIAAMFDPLVVEDPERFAYDRTFELNYAFAKARGRYGAPPDSGPSPYLMFGTGTHWCLGDQMALAEISSMGLALLYKLADPRIAEGVRYDGPAVASLLLEQGA